MSKLIAAKPADLRVPVLTVNNYRIWSELVITALDGRGVGDYIKSNKKPTDTSELQIWRQNNAIAVRIIKGTLLES